MKTHWYSHDTQKMIETDIRDARSRGLLPSVSTIVELATGAGHAFYREMSAIEAAADLFLSSGVPARRQDIEAEIGRRIAAKRNDILNTGKTLHEVLAHVTINRCLPPASSLLYNPSATWWPGVVNYLGIIYNKVSNLAAEHPIASRALGYGGTLDSMVRVDRNKAFNPPKIVKKGGFVVPGPSDVIIQDFKSQRFGKSGRVNWSWSWAIQLAAYGQLVREANIILDGQRIHYASVAFDVGPNGFLPVWRFWSQEEINAAYYEFELLLAFWKSYNRWMDKGGPDPDVVNDPTEVVVGIPEVALNSNEPASPF